MQINNSAFKLGAALLAAGIFPLKVMATADNSVSIDYLKKAAYYSRGLSGFVGQISKQDFIFEETLKSNKAEKLFMEIIQSEEPTPAAKIYSICGLKKINSAKITFALANKRNKKLQVPVLRGDVLRKEEYEAIANNISKNGC